MNNNLSSSELLNQTNSINNLCTYHNEQYFSFCKSCCTQICRFCEDSHFNHELIDFKIIQPQKEEIDLLKEIIKKYEEDYNNILSKIISWKKMIDNIISSFQAQIKNNQKMNQNIDFIFNKCDYNYMNYYSILKFRQIFANIIEPQIGQNDTNLLKYMQTNNMTFNDNKMGLFDYNNYNKMKFYLDKIIDSDDEYKFINNSINIINFLWEIYSSNIKKKNIIEKFIDLSKYKKRNNNIININKDINNISFDELNKTQPNILPKINNIFLESNFLKIDTNDMQETNRKNQNIKPKLIKLNFDNTQGRNNIYFKKRSNSNINNFCNKNRKNISLNINEFNTNLNINKINLYLKDDKIEATDKNINKELIINRNNHKNKKNHKNNNNKNKQKKTYIHKKFEPKKNILNKDDNIIEIVTKTPKRSNKSEKNKFYGINYYFNDSK